jgi:hypothetical protein
MTYPIGEETTEWALLLTRASGTWKPAWKLLPMLDEPAARAAVGAARYRRDRFSVATVMRRTVRVIATPWEPADEDDQ